MKEEYPSAIATVDVIPYSYVDEEILLGKKNKHGGKLCFIGGFVDAVKDTNFYDAAKRELKEEVTSLDVTFPPLEYLYSMKVDDPRYRDRAAKIFTSIFIYQTSKRPQVAGDDLDEVVWVSLSNLLANPNILVDEHASLIEDIIIEIKWRYRDE